MRSSLSCEYCRKSKIKCVNSGSPPCSKCEKLGRSGCELTRPRVAVPLAKPSLKRKRTRSAARQADPVEPHLAPEVPQHVSPSYAVLSDPSPGLSVSRLSTQTRRRNKVDDYLAAIPTDVILKALNVFTSKFPELRILQPSLFIREFQSHRSEEAKALLATVLASVKKQPAVFSDTWASELPDAQDLACYARRVLSDCILQPPKVIVVQALLILTLFEWGVRDFHKAWMHCGIAIRIMQSLHSSRVAPFPLDTSYGSEMDALSAAVEARTYWACFIMDCTINSGTYNPRMLPKPEMQKLKVARPPTSVEFAFGSDTAPSRQISGDPGMPVTLDIAHSFEIMAEGFDINAQVMAFVFNDGRRAPGMCAPENCPWVPGSPWSECRKRLQEWRDRQHSRLHYPNNSVAIYMTLGFGETFIYLNLLYYQSLMLIHREYFPFLPPSADTTPQGPIDHPLLEAEAPPGWWDECARELFDSSDQVTYLLKEAADCGISVMTPFSGFCAFSACFGSLYVYRFPGMNFGRSPKAKELMEMGLDYLREFQHIWDLGGGWIKTIQNSSLLYERATSESRPYRGKNRFDFEVLHQSVHEYRIIDRSDLQIQQIRRAERDAASRVHVPTEGSSDAEGLVTDEQAVTNQFPSDLNINLEDPGLWPNWWSMLEEVDFAGGLTSL
ncbi:hypothetical protein BGZ63DRAFT_473743 [Mariannaea sp. PMI_226]|nr:hypothetical protein BGZ63DRAFT_473743 [Mariannaea sp. PMI_226]